MNRSRIKRTTSAAMVAGMLVIAGCDAAVTGGRKPAGLPTLPPTATPVPGEATPTPSTAPTVSMTPTTSPSEVEGGTEILPTSSPTPSRTPPTVSNVVLLPESDTINLPAADQNKSAGIRSTATFTALVTLSDNSSSDSVVWSIADPIATVNAGVATALASGSTVITATSIATPSKSATASLTVTDYGALGVTLN